MNRRRVLGVLLPVLVVAALVVFGHFVPFRAWLAAFVHWVDGLGPAGMALYAVVYALVAVLMLPAWLMTVAAGMIFGFFPGVAIVLTGATAGAAASFLIARYVARDRVARAAERNPKFRALDRAIGQEGWRIVFLLRMSVVVPFTFSNYVYGLTAIRFWPYVASSALGMVPVTSLYVALGMAAGRMGVENKAAFSGPLALAVIVAGVLITAGVTLYVARLTRWAMAAEHRETVETV